MLVPEENGFKVDEQSVIMASSSEMSYGGNFTMEYDDPYLKSPLKQILIVSFTLTFLLGLAGNLLVIFVIARNRSMHTVTNFFLANLAVADLLVSIFCVIPKLLYFVSAAWYYSDFLCKIHNYVMSATTTSSIFILTVISMERFIAILRPLETKRLLTAKRLTVVMAAVWIASATFNIHTIWYHEVVESEGVPYCSASELMFEMDNKASKIQTIVFFLIYYVIPLLVMVVLYGFICQKLWMSSKLMLVASSIDKKDPQQPRRNFFHRVRYMIRPRNGATPSDDKQAKDQNFGSAAGNNQHAALSNPEEVQVLLETQMSNESAGGAEQKIGPFYLDEPDDDSCGTPTCPADHANIYKPQNKSPEIRFQVDAARNAASPTGTGTGKMQETSLSEPGSKGPVKGSANTCPNNNIPPAAAAHTRPNQAGRSRTQDRNSLSPPRPLTISKPERSKSKKNKKREAIAARKKVIKLLIVIVSSFALCLLPYQVIALWMTFDEAFPHNAYAMQVFIPFTFLCYFFNSALNPFLYAFLSDNFRKRMKETLTLRSSARRKSWMRTQARLRSMTEGNTETETVYTCT